MEEIMIECDLALLERFNLQYANGIFTKISINTYYGKDHPWVHYSKDKSSLNIFYSTRFCSLLKEENPCALALRKSFLKHEVLEAYLNDHEEANKVLRAESEMEDVSDWFLLDNPHDWKGIEEHIKLVSVRSRTTLEEAADYVLPRIIIQKSQ